MASAKRWGLGFLGLAALSLSGCVGPMACGPTGCDAHGPVAWNDCGGCGDCGSCDEWYIDPWINHPADACDPCDGCGNYNGQSCGKCRPMFSGYKSLWGYRRDPGPPSCDAGACHGGGCRGCDSCDAAPMPTGSTLRRIPHSGSRHGVPTPAPEVIWEDEDWGDADPEAVPLPPKPATNGPAANGPATDGPNADDQSRTAPRRTRQIFRSRAGIAGNAPRPRGY